MALHTVVSSGCTYSNCILYDCDLNEATLDSCLIIKSLLNIHVTNSVLVDSSISTDHIDYDNSNPKSSVSNSYLYGCKWLQGTWTANRNLKETYVRLYMHKLTNCRHKAKDTQLTLS